MPPPRPLAELLALIAPPSCAACRAPLLEADRMVCSACVRELPWLRGAPCPRCGLTRHRARGGCPAAQAAFTAAWAPLAYDGVARQLVAALKFSGALPLADVMAAHVAANLPAGLRRADALVPVPPHRGRRRRRGYDPAGVLAAAVAPRLGLPLVRCLARGGGRRQVGAGRTARRDPHRLVVRLTRAPPPRVLLLDDVHTTGGTLDACARALAVGGSRVIVAVSYARTL
jgi:predicted amidophosphoribosyltransferase